VLLKTLNAEGDAAVRITDFGLSIRLNGMPNGCATDVVGTPKYMAPQAIKGEPYGYEVDVWGLGVLLYELLSGTHPFEHEDEKQQNALITSGRWNFHHPNWKDVSEEARELVSIMLVVEPKQRATLETINTHPWVTREAELAELTRDLEAEADAEVEAVSLQEGMVTPEPLAHSRAETPSRLGKLSRSMSRVSRASWVSRTSQDSHTSTPSVLTRGSSVTSQRVPLWRQESLTNVTPPTLSGTLNLMRRRSTMGSIVPPSNMMEQGPDAGALAVIAASPKGNSIHRNANCDQTGSRSASGSGVPLL
jgi:serine/threonine protein kinase